MRSQNPLCATLPSARDLAELAFERLVSLARKIGIELAELGGLGDEAFIGALHVVALHLKGLLERLGADELLGRGGALLEDLFRVVRKLDRNRLRALGER